MSSSRRSRWRGCAAIGALAFLVVLALASTAQAAERATFRLLGSSPIYSQVDVFKASGGSVGVRPARYHYRITTPSGVVEASGHCVDLAHYIVTGRDYQVDLQTAADTPALATPEMLAAGWLLSQEDQLIAEAADPALEAGALQVAVWQLSGQARSGDAPSSSAALNARVNALKTWAMGKQVPSVLSVSLTEPAGGACANVPASVTVTGTPGAVVDLSVTSGQASLAQSQVEIDATGVAQTAILAPNPGEVTVSATTSAPTLLRATKLAGQTSPQDQLYLRPGTLTDEASLTFADCTIGELSPIGSFKPFDPVAPAPGGAPTAPGAAPAADPIAVTLDAPRMAAPGGVAVYHLTIRNSGPTARKGVTVRQKLGAGVAAIAAKGPKGARVRVAKGSAAWTLAKLAPGASAKLTLKVRVGRKVTGGIARTTVSATAGPKAKATAAAATAVVRKVGKAEQGH
ncbi:MAG: hypothetical protein AB7L91_19330 [Dehalococcoidia bacterium]